MFELFKQLTLFPYWPPVLKNRLRPGLNRLAVPLVNLRLRWRWARKRSRIKVVVLNTPAWARRTRPAAAGRVRCVEVIPTSTIAHPAPRTIPLARSEPWPVKRFGNEYLPPMHVVTVPGGRFDGDNYGVTTASGELLAEMSFYGPEWAFQESLAVLKWPSHEYAPRKVPGVVAVLASRYAEVNYFHWLFNVLPRFELLRRAGLTFERTDQFVISVPVRPFHLNTLNHLGIDSDKLIMTHKHTSLAADELWATSDLRLAGHRSPWVNDFLRGLFLNDEPKARPSGRLRLYITRRDAGTRILSNELEIEALVAARGFQMVYASHLTMHEQAVLFAQAEAVVSPHGAGLSNVVFCSPGTKVFELFPPDLPHVHYWELSNSRGLEYYYLIAERDPADPAKYSYRLPAAWLDQLLASAGL